MPAKRAIIAVAILPLAAWGQKPVISSVVNAASYATGEYASATVTTPIQILGEGSIASVFGTNLAATTAEAAGVPLPRQLAGTAVSVDGIAAPLFYVSPTQVNFQIPGGNDTVPGASSAQGVVVATAAGLSDAYTLVNGGGASALGIFTQDASGCGAGAVLNVSVDGSVSLNSPANSAQPGSYISIYGTGLEEIYYAYNWPPDGTPTPSSPLATANPPAEAIFDFAQPNDYAAYTWGGMAPGFVGLAQFNYQIPAAVREGCAVPLQLLADNNMTPPVTVSIAKGGGPCTDPPSQGNGLITWEKIVTTSVDNTVTESDTVTVSLQGQGACPTLAGRQMAKVQ